MSDNKGSKCSANCHRPSTAQAHCSMCHETFASVNLFDQHHANCYITKDKEQTYVCECATPVTMSLVQFNGAWYTVDGAAKAQAGSDRLRDVRSRGPQST
jgi:hypothetical protein